MIINIIFIIIISFIFLLGSAYLYVDLQRSVLHTDLPAPNCFECNYCLIYTLWFQNDKIGMS